MAARSVKAPRSGAVSKHGSSAGGVGGGDINEVGRDSVRITSDIAGQINENGRAALSTETNNSCRHCAIHKH
jgi:hypothetical protein